MWCARIARMSPTGGGRQRPPRDLSLFVGHHEIAEMLGVNVATIYKWRQRYEDFPEPLLELAMGPLFWAPHVQTWFKKKWG